MHSSVELKSIGNDPVTPGPQVLTCRWRKEWLANSWSLLGRSSQHHELGQPQFESVDHPGRHLHLLDAAFSYCLY
jgi:hypothetical protein